MAAEPVPPARTFRRPARRAATVMLAACAILASAAPVAHAAQRFAAPTAVGAMDCSSAADACSITTALTALNTNDEVILAAGDYVVGTQLTADGAAGVVVHGAAGQARPRIISSANTAWYNTANAVLRRVEIVHSGTNAGLRLASGTVEQVYVQTTTAPAACKLDVGGSVVIRDSVCWNTAAAGDPVGLYQLAALSTEMFATLRNVTAVAPAGTGIRARASNATDKVNMTGTNVIASGVIDVSAQAGGTASTTYSIVTLDHSNYDTEQEAVCCSGIDGIRTVTDPGTGTNQTAAPSFANAAMGDFHQLLGSPTIDMGVGGAGLGTADIDGEARTQGSLPDIGADEFTPAPPGAPAATPAAKPAPTPAKKCKKKRKKRAAAAAKCRKKKRK